MAYCVPVSFLLPYRNMSGTTSADLAQRIRDARNDLGLTQDEFADRLGVSGRAVRHWEAGDRKPGPWAVRALARVTKSDYRRFQERDVA
jgi:DNA-binding transcriptional regulator YiaG